MPSKFDTISSMDHIKNTIFEYKAFSGAIAVMLLFLLFRIPLGAYNEPSLLDIVAHFVLPAVGGPLLAVLAQRLGALKAGSKAAFVLLACLLAIAAEVLWEIFEYWVDTLFGLTWQPSNADTMADIMLTVVGAAIGSVVFLVVYRSSKFVSSGKQ